MAWFPDASVRGDLAVLAVHTARTDAEEVVDQVYAVAVVLARRLLATAAFQLASAAQGNFVVWEAEDSLGW